MVITITDILKYLEKQQYEFQFHGNEQVVIEGFSSLNNYREQTVTWIKKEENWNPDLKNRISLCIVQNGVQVDAANQIISDNSKLIFFSIIDHFWNEEKTASVAKSAVVDSEHIEQDVSIGENCYIGKDVTIGHNTVIEHNVCIYHRVTIGDNCIIHSGTVIGADGFGYSVNEAGQPVKVPHYGGVRIGDDVEIGANSCIDRGTIDDTVIASHVKIDNLVHIAHNVKIEASAMIVAGAIVCGSAVIEREGYVAPGGIVKNQMHIGKNAFVGMGAVVTRPVEDHTVVAGIPAKPLRSVTLNDK